VSIEVFGEHEYSVALAAIAARVDVATGHATHEAAKHVQTHAHELLTQRSHARGTPTPSPPGSPPARISGDLAGSVKAHDPERHELGHWSAETAPDTPYAAIQEHGGHAGRGGASHLPARPYMAPAVEHSKPQIAAGYYEAWAAAIVA
jgi:hypothetical protein